MTERQIYEYKSKSQIARVKTERWVEENGYCLACQSDRLFPTKPNTQARDFECDKCGHAYELKSALRPFGNRVVDGAYSSMMRRIQSATVPSFLLLQYSATWNVTNLWAIHHLLITASAIEERKALALTARRAGWIGCNINLSGIPPEGRIPIIVDGQPISKGKARALFAPPQQLSHLSPAARGWTAAVLKHLHELGKSPFTIRDAYMLEDRLSLLYPGNNNVRPKIRQQLQVLRDAGLIRFDARGVYSFANSQ